MRVAVTGLALWAPGFPSLDAWTRGEADETVAEPTCALAHPRAKRGTSRIARMLGEVVQQTVTDGGADISTVSTVYASAWGEIDIMVGLLEQIFDGDVGLSPLRFKHSVHNAASGLVSIAAENRGFSTALAAGDRTVEQGLVEALCVLATTETQDVVLAVGDDRLPIPLERFGRYEGLAVGLCLTREPAARRVRAWLDGPRRLDGPSQVRAPAAFAENPCAWVLPLVDAIAKGATELVPLSAAERPFGVAVSPGGGA